MSVSCQALQPRLIDACSNKSHKKNRCVDTWSHSGTPGSVHIWDAAPCWTPPPPAHPAPRGVSAHHYLPLPLIARTQHWQRGNTSEARSCRRGSRCLMAWISFWQSPPDWQINIGWLWPHLTAGSSAFCPASTGLEAGWLSEKDERRTTFKAVFGSDCWQLHSIFQSKMQLHAVNTLHYLCEEKWGKKVCFFLFS